jgi:hypothetical protein
MTEVDDELESLLAEFESATVEQRAEAAPEAPQPEPEPEPPPTLDLEGLSDALYQQGAHGVQEQLGSVEAELQYQSDKAELGKAIGRARELLGERGALVTDRILENELLMRYQSDAEFHNAYEGRHDWPRQWQHALDKAIRQFGSELDSLPDPVATADRNAIHAAMLAASQMPAGRDDRPFNWDRVTDRDFDNMVRKIINP